MRRNTLPLQKPVSPRKTRHSYCIALFPPHVQRSIALSKFTTVQNQVQKQPRRTYYISEIQQYWSLHPLEHLGTSFNGDAQPNACTRTRGDYLKEMAREVHLPNSIHIRARCWTDIFSTPAKQFTRTGTLA